MPFPFLYRSLCPRSNPTCFSRSILAVGAEHAKECLRRSAMTGNIAWCLTKILITIMYDGNYMEFKFNLTPSNYPLMTPIFTRSKHKSTDQPICPTTRTPELLSSGVRVTCSRQERNPVPMTGAGHGTETNQRTFKGLRRHTGRGLGATVRCRPRINPGTGLLRIARTPPTAQQSVRREGE